MLKLTEDVFDDMLATFSRDTQEIMLKELVVAHESMLGELKELLRSDDIDAAERQAQEHEKIDFFILRLQAVMKEYADLHRVNGENVVSGDDEDDL